MYAVAQRFRALSIWARLGVHELLVDRTDELDRNDIELVRKEAELSVFRINGLEEFGNPRQVMSGGCVLTDEGGNISPLKVWASHSNSLLVADRSHRIAGNAV